MLNRFWIAAAAFAVCVNQASAEITVGVSWFKFADERWKFDEAGIKAVLDAAGARYISADANFSVEKAVSDVENLITRGADVLILAVSSAAEAIIPAVNQALAEGIPVIAYEFPIWHPDVFYVSFDGQSVGRELAKGLLEAAPTGNYAIIKGDDADQNTYQYMKSFTAEMQPSYDSGDVTVVAEQFINGWRPELAKDAFEQILTAQNNDIQAVMVMNDGMASGVSQALIEQGLDIPISGQDGAPGALNRVARGQQTFTIWKNAYELGQEAARIALDLAQGREIENEVRFDSGPKGLELRATLLPIQRIDASNLDVPVASGWATKEQICAGVTENPPPLCQ